MAKAKGIETRARACDARRAAVGLCASRVAKKKAALTIRFDSPQEDVGMVNQAESRR